ncbi:hypothetical protein HYS47_04315 [Candidatus Woesearchaeota archaeon]|nr:hypothetical protein [Candidatus Woesearchaeota archaeon]
MNPVYQLRRRDLLLAGAYTLLGASCRFLQPKTDLTSDVYKQGGQEDNKADEANKGKEQRDAHTAPADTNQAQTPTLSPLDALLERNKKLWPNHEIIVYGEKDTLDVSRWVTKEVRIGMPVSIDGVTDQQEGKGLLISIGASWCAPCGEQLDYLKYVYTQPEFKPIAEQVGTAYLLFDKEEAIVKRVAEGVPFPVLARTEGYNKETFRQIWKYVVGNVLLPINFLLDQERRLVWATPRLLDHVIKNGESFSMINGHVWTCLDAIAAEGQRRKEQQKEKERYERHERSAYSLAHPPFTPAVLLSGSER